MLTFCIKCKNSHSELELSKGLCSKCVTSKIDISNLVLTSRGLIPIDLVDVNDVVFTHKKRFRQILGIKSENSSIISKTTLSLQTYIPRTYEIFKLNNGVIPFYPPKDRNDDKHDVSFWERAGKALSDPSRMSLEMKKYLETYKVNSINDIPITFLTMADNKVEAFLKGFFKKANGLKNLNLKGELNLMFLLNKSLNLQYTNDLVMFEELTKVSKVKTLIVEEDNSYSVNGLILIKK